MATVDNLTAVLHGIEDLRLVRFSLSLIYPHSTQRRGF